MKETELEQSLQLANTRFRVQVILGDIKFWDGTLHLAGTGLIATTIIAADLEVAYLVAFVFSLQCTPHHFRNVIHVNF